MIQSDLGRYNHTKDTPPILTTRIKETKSSDNPDNLEAISYESMSICARFEICSAPKCPLDILLNLRTEDQDDPKCEMAKATRHKYWLSMPESLRSKLEYQGYFETEYNRMKSARERWESLPDAKKQEIRERMRNARTQRQ